MSNSVVSNNWGSMDCVSDNRGVVSGCSVSHRVSHHSLRVLGLAIIGHISHVSVIGAGVVVDMLDPAIRESHGVRSLGIAGTVRALSCLEVSLGVVISHGIRVGVGGDHIRLSVVSRAMSNHRGVIGGGSVNSVSYNWSCVDSVSNSMMSEANSMMGNMTESMTQQRSGVTQVSMTQGGDTMVTKETSRGGTRSGNQG